MKYVIDNLADYPEQEIQDYLLKLRSKITSLEWDAQKDQLNPGKKVYLDKIREEHNILKEKYQEVFKKK